MQARKVVKKTGEPTETKILICDPVPRETPPPYYEWKLSTLEKVARPGTVLEYTSLKQGYFSMPTTPYRHVVNAAGVAEQCYIAEKKGYDAFVIGGVCDFLAECRSLVEIPVVSPIESAEHLASMLGYRFSIIASSPPWLGTLEDQLLRFGLKDKLASIRYPSRLGEEDPWEWFREEKQQELVEIITSEMRKAVQEDGAEALLVGFSVAGTVLTMHGVYEVEGAPVIDIMVAGIKVAEILVDLHRAFGTKVCKATIYHNPPGWEEERPIAVD